jgi:hypothetical protein
MRILMMTALAAMALATAACSGSGADRDSASVGAGAEANLDAENFDVTVNSDDVTLNEAEARQLNVATE